MRALLLLSAAMIGCAALPPARRPVTVARASDVDRDVFEAALDFWNVELGGRVLVDASDELGADPDVLVVTGAYAGEHLASAGPGLVRIHDPLSGFVALAHELGHAAFGLGHAGTCLPPVLATRELPWCSVMAAELDLGDASGPTAASLGVRVYVPAEQLAQVRKEHL